MRQLQKLPVRPVGRPGPAPAPARGRRRRDHPVAALPGPGRPRAGRRRRSSGSSGSWPTSTGGSASSAGSVARRFDAVLGLLEALGLRAGLVAHRPGRAARAHLPRERPAAGRGGRPRACSTTSTRRRSPRSPRASPTSTAAASRRRRRGSPRPTCAAGSSSSSGSAATCRRPSARPSCPRPACPTRPSPPLAHAWASGADLATRARRRGPVGRRLRAQHPPAHRPAAPAGRRRAGAGHPVAPPTRRPTRCSAAWSPPRRSSAPASTTTSPSAPTTSRRPDAGPAGRGRGGPGAPARPTGWSCAPTPRPAPWWRAPGGPASRCPRSACSAATCAAPSAARATSGGCGDGRRALPEVDLGVGAASTGGCTGSSPTSSPGGAGWRGRIVALMNAQFLGEWDVAPRAHPGDGKLDRLSVSMRPRRAAPGPHPPAARAPTCPTPASPSPRSPTPSSSSSGPPRCGSTASVVGEARSLTIRVEPAALRVVV